jgi:uncharacterized membrane protein
LTATRYQLIASVSLVALIALCLVWEGWLAPLRPGGSWLILKAVFLLPPLFGIFRGKRYTYKWLSLFIQFYLLEGACAPPAMSACRNGWRWPKHCLPPLSL